MPIARSFVAKVPANSIRSISRPGLEVDLEATVDGLLGGAQRVGRAADVAGEPGRRGGVDLGRGDDLVDEPDGERLGGAHDPAGEDEVLGLRRPDEAREALGAAGAGDDAEEDLGLAEPGVVGRDAEVAGERDLAPAAERVAGDGGDGRLGQPRPAPG